MNERIRELRCKAQESAAEAFPGNIPFDPNPDPILWDRIHLSYELFAQLIVQECITVIENKMPDFTCKEDYENLIRKAGRMDAIDEIKQHFGVEQ